mmetsp:Transcript_26556/g.58199  ORF Transcript_26556/g.58199 Transcript_26556/m.58199 type:complete len:620 (+) Transcript_26556:2-1861(+)
MCALTKTEVNENEVGKEEETSGEKSVDVKKSTTASGVVTQGEKTYNRETVSTTGQKGLPNTEVRELQPTLPMDDFFDYLCALMKTEANEKEAGEWEETYVAYNEKACNRETETNAMKEGLPNTEVRELQSALTMSNFPRFEVVGYSKSSVHKRKKSNSERKKKEGKEKRRGKNSSNRRPVKSIQVSGKAETIESVDQQQLKTSITAENIPRFEVVGLKGNKAEAKPVLQKVKMQRKFKKVHTPNQQVFPSKKSKRENDREQNTSKESEKQRRSLRSFVQKLNPEKQEAPKRDKNDSSKTGQRIDMTDNKIDEDVPETSNQEQVEEVPPVAVTRKQIVGLISNDPQTQILSPEVCGLEDRKLTSVPSRDISQCVLSLTETPSSLSGWIGNRLSDQTNDKKESVDGGSASLDEDEDEDYKYRFQQKKYDGLLNFLQALRNRRKDNAEDIVECLSPVLSIGTSGSYETGVCFHNEDEDYVNHYYDFGESVQRFEESSDEEGSFSEEFDHGDDDSFIYAIQALSKDEATMSFLKKALETSQSHNLDVNGKREAKQVIDARNDFGEVIRPASGRRAGAPEMRKKRNQRSNFPKVENRYQKQIRNTGCTRLEELDSDLLSFEIKK